MTTPALRIKNKVNKALLTIDLATWDRMLQNRVSL